MFRSVTRLFIAVHPVRHRRRRSYKRRPRLESLEARQLLAVVFTPTLPQAPLVNQPDVGLGVVGGFNFDEPLLEVNPVDPGNVVVTSHGGMRNSTNAGGTFAGTVGFPDLGGGGNSGDTAMAFDSRGRLFWATLNSVNDRDIQVTQVNPATGAQIGATVNIQTVSGDIAGGDDKEFLAADEFAGSPFRDNLYVAWSKLGVGTVFPVDTASAEVFFSRSINQGVNWSLPVQLSDSASEGFTWPADVGGAPNGDVYVAYHAQSGAGPVGGVSGVGNPDGVSGQVFVLRSTDGGAGDFDRQFTLASGDIGPIPDNGPTVFFDLPVLDIRGDILDVEVTLDISHDFDDDLDVFLISPLGTRVELFTDVGGGGNNFTTTTLDDEAVTAITAGVAPFTGRFIPEGSLANFDGEAVTGTWQLEITDDAAGDLGTLNAWSLTLTVDTTKTVAFGPGQADITYNVQDAPGSIPDTAFWMLGSGQPWVLPDPARPGHVYVVANDDPDNVHGSGDDGDVVLARSTDHGLTWDRITVPDGSDGAHQLFPFASIDEFGTIVIAWYDTRRGLFNDGPDNTAGNADDNLLLDVFATYSTDGGVTWAPAFQVNDPANPFDPDFPNNQRRYPGPQQTPCNIPANETCRIGEYFAIDHFGGTAYVGWEGNARNGAGNVTGDQMQFSTFAIGGSLTVDGDDSGAVTDDDFVLRGINGAPGFIEVINDAVLVNGMPQRVYAGLLDGVSAGVAINGLAGNDTLTVDFSNGNPIPLGGLHWNGGVQTSTPGDSLRLVGNGDEHGFYTPSPNTPGAGIVEVDGRTIDFTGLEPVVASGFFEFTFITPNSNDVLTIDSPAAGQNRISGTSGNVAFEALTFFDINHFKIDTAANDAPLADSNDEVTFASDLVASGLDSFTIETGMGNDTVNAGAITAAGQTGVTVLAGDGDDILTGGELPDFLDGGRGNDTAVGGPGLDVFHGGDESDTFTWNQGDGDDLVEGGEGLDVLVFNGNAAGSDTITLSPGSPNPTRLLLSRTQGGIEIDAAGVEHVAVNGLADGAADTITVNDLTGTDVRAVNVDVDAAGGTDAVVVNGATTADDIAVSTAAGVVLVAGLYAQVRIANAASPDSLTVNGNEGDDEIKVEPGVEAVLDITLNGGAGDDFLSADAIINGGPGDDVLIGGAGNDTLNGDAGEDFLIGGGGDDTFDGGADFDTILIAGTSGDDVIDVVEDFGFAPDVRLTHTVNGVTENDQIVVAAGNVTVERALVEAGDGADLVRFRIADEFFDDAGPPFGLSMVMEARGGGHTAAGDRLIVVDDSVDDLVLYRKDVSDSDGTVTVGPGNPEPFQHVFTGFERVQFLDENGDPLNQAPGDLARLVVFKHDPFEFNDDRFTATHLGANETINLDPTIDPGPLLNPFGDNQDVPGDEDWYQVEAEVSGTIDFQVLFEEIGMLAGGRPGLPTEGDLNINVFDSDGMAIAGFTTSDDNDDNERVRIPAVQGEVYYFQVLGDTDAINVYDVTVINLPALTPYDLELDDEPVGDPPPANSDTGRNDNDNVTRENTPTIVFRLDDAFFLNDLPGNDAAGTPLGDVPIPIPFQPGPAQPALPGYAIAIFDEGDTPGGPANEEPQTPLGFATMVEPGVYQFTTPILADGSHFLTARVQMLDPADPLQTGFGPRSLSLEILVDTVVPPVSFGEPGIADDGIVPDGDSGVSPPNPDTIVDLITNETSPTFWGRAEANAIIRLFADLDNDGVLDAAELSDGFVGQATAIPIDGNEQEGVPPNMLPHTGFWTIKSVINFNDPDLFPLDGLRTIFVTAEDLAGNVNGDDLGEEILFDFFVDTQGPVINFVQITAAPAFDLFDPKPTPTPTPLVDSLTIKFTDLPPRVAGFLFPALKADTVHPGHFHLIGDHNGIIPIEEVVLTQFFTMMGADTIAMATVELRFFEPLPDDRFTLIVDDDIMDPAGNRLDGETNAAEPQEDPIFPTGDGIPGFDFVARFTVDSRPEVAVYSGRTVFVDTNGNQFFDPRSQIDFTDRDVVYYFGLPTDDIFVGNFATDFGAATDGFDKLAAYGNIGGAFRFLIDNDNDGVPDAFPMGKPGGPFNTAAINATPIAGNFDGGLVPFAGLANGDEVGLFDGTKWYLDTNHNFNVDPAEGDLVITGAIRGLPIVGDFDGNGVDDLATFNDFRNRFEIDLLGPGFAPGNIDRVLLFGFPGTNDQPVAGDINQDGIDDLGLYAPQEGAGTPDEQAFFHLMITQGGLPLWNVTAANGSQAFAAAVPTDLVGNPAAAGAIFVQLNFKPIPFGNDTLATFGEDFAVPLLGNFDPPVGPAIGTPEDPIGGPETDTNLRNTLDVNDDGVVSVGDLIAVVLAIRTAGGLHPASRDNAAPYSDVNANGIVSVQDLLLIVDYLRNPENQRGGEGESQQSAAATTLLFIGLATSEQRDDATDAAAVDEVAARPDSVAIDAVAADVAAASPGGEAEPVGLLDDESDEMEDAIDAIIGDLVQA